MTATFGKRDLIDGVNDATKGDRKDYLTRGDVEQIVNATIDQVQEIVARGDEVRIPGFGTFSRSLRRARQQANPQTGETMQLPAAYVPKFKAGKTFKDLVGRTKPNTW